jgi:hypothetical protein
MVLEFFTDPKTIPRDLHHIINEGMISAYFAALTQVDDPDSHLRSDAQELNSVLISSTDLVLLLELVFQNQACDSNFMKLVQVVQPAVAVLQVKRKKNDVRREREGKKLPIMNHANFFKKGRDAIPCG